MVDFSEKHNGIFSGEKFIHNTLLNLFGLHILRIILAHFCYTLRSRSLFTNFTEEQKTLRKDGILIIKNYFPNDVFEAIKKEHQNAKNIDGTDIEINDGNSSWTQRKFNRAQQKNLPSTQNLLSDKQVLDIVSAGEARRITAGPVWFEKVTGIDSNTVDPQKVLHTDIFYPSHKVYYFLSDVTADDGPLNVAPGSHNLSFQRLWFEYKKSVIHKKDEMDSFRVNEKEESLMGLKTLEVIVPANSIVIMNGCAFHKRGDLSIGKSRSAIFFFFRFNPFSRKTNI